ncbi:MAG: LLM class flavin-dependent oxidoreductase [Chloroflexota bacterium]|nr:MAG: LLM class flavin-dependent oxidoreductase [SAR202 cluster bacterium]MEC8987094.1 LLM class flavin-dependent oxidoreductase [Chloroflexota bacterium]MEE3345166.1 LLM class flavin-dependent oxidoreductase [Chloroflexota bacterium]
MKVGIFDHVERLKHLSLPVQYAQRISMVKKAETLGFYSYHVAEHHHSPLTAAPVQGAYLGALASVTSTIRLCPLVYVLPLHHPIRIIEEICTLDNLTSGRLDVGFGRGAPVGDELAMWGQNPLDSDDIYNESVEIVMQGLTEEFINYSGNHYQFEDLWMELSPFQKPHPPIWVAGNPVKAGQIGGNLITEGTVADLPKINTIYSETRAEYETKKSRFHFFQNPLLGVSKRIFIGKTDKSALQRAEKSFEIYRSNFRKPLPGGESRRPKIMIESEIGKRILPWTIDFETAIEKEQVVAGSADSVINYLKKYENNSDCNFLLISFQWGDLNHEEAINTMEIVGTEFIGSN